MTEHDFKQLTRAVGQLKRLDGYPRGRDLVCHMQSKGRTQGQIAEFLRMMVNPVTLMGKSNTVGHMSGIWDRRNVELALIFLTEATND